MKEKGWAVPAHPFKNKTHPRIVQGWVVIALVTAFR